MRGIFFAGIVLVTTVPSVFAATVNVSVGPVSINTGSGYKAVNTGAAVNPGDSVMVGAGASAKIVYADGCVQTIAAGDTASVGGSSPCSAARPEGRMGATSSSSQAGTEMDMLVVGTLGAAAIGAGIYAVTKNDAASP